MLELNQNHSVTIFTVQITNHLTSELKDLDVLIDDNLKFSHHISEKDNKASNNGFNM